jgi:hypothetical protein
MTDAVAERLLASRLTKQRFWSNDGRPRSCAKGLSGCTKIVCSTRLLPALKTHRLTPRKSSTAAVPELIDFVRSIWLSGLILLSMHRKKSA